MGPRTLLLPSVNRGVVLLDKAAIDCCCEVSCCAWLVCCVCKSLICYVWVVWVFCKLVIAFCWLLSYVAWLASCCCKLAMALLIGARPALIAFFTSRKVANLGAALAGVLAMMSSEVSSRVAVRASLMSGKLCRLRILNC